MDLTAITTAGAVLFGIAALITAVVTAIISARKSELDTLRAIIDQQDKEIAQLRLEVVNLRARNEALIKKQDLEIEKLEREVKALREENIQLRARVLCLEKENERLREIQK